MTISTGLLMVIAGGASTLLFLMLMISLPGHFRKKRKDLLHRMEGE